MAVFIPGMPCGLCGQPIQPHRGQDVISFRPFLSNQLDALWEFSDCVFHAACFETHPLAQQVLARLQEMQEKVPTWPPPCALCGRIVSELFLASPASERELAVLGDGSRSTLQGIRNR